MRVTASRTALWFTCAYSARSDVPVDPDRPNEYQAWGLANHDALEVLQHGGEPDLHAIADARELTPAQRLALPRSIAALKAIDAPKLAHSEVAFALDLDTGEGRELGQRIGQRIGRAYKEHGAREGVDFCGTVDLAWMCTEESLRGYVRIIDLKSGFEGRVQDHLPQLLSLAAMVCRTWDARGAMLTVFHLHGGEVNEDNLIVEDYELDAHVARLQERRRETPDAQPVPGEHCRSMYCTAIGSCPAGQRVVTALIPASRLTCKLTGTIETVEEAATRVSLLPLLKERVKQYERECREWAEKNGGGVQLPNQWWGMTTIPKRSITPSPEALRVLEDEFGAAGAAAALGTVVTQTSIKRAAEALGLTPASSVLERILGRLKACGALEVHDEERWVFRDRPPFKKPGRIQAPPPSGPRVSSEDEVPRSTLFDDVGDEAPL